MFNMESSLSSYEQKGQVLSFQQTQQNLNRRVLKQTDKEVDSEQNKAFKAIRFAPQPEQALDNEFNSSIYFDLSEAKAKTDSKVDSIVQGADSKN